MLINHCITVFLLDGSNFFSQHFAKANTKLNLPIECGLGLESRRRTLGSGFRHVAGGRDAKILNVSTNVLNICHLIRY